MKPLIENNGKSPDKSSGELKYGVAWDDRLKSGYEPIDGQHRALFERVSEQAAATINSLFN